MMNLTNRVAWTYRPQQTQNDEAEATTTKAALGGITCPKRIIEHLRTAFATRLLPLVLLCTLAAKVQAQDYTYTTDNGTVTITQYTGSGGAVTIPSVINGMPVTRIGQKAFYGCASSTITIPNSVTTIGPEAVSSCYSLANVTILNGVISIGQDAFCGCASLTSVTVPKSVTSIAVWAFCSCTSLTSVTIPDSVTSIGASTFCGCTRLTSVTIPNGATSIVDGEFYGCTSLTGNCLEQEITEVTEKQQVALFWQDKDTIAAKGRWIGESGGILKQT